MRNFTTISELTNLSGGSGKQFPAPSGAAQTRVWKDYVARDKWLFNYMFTYPDKYDLQIVII